jgi:hypothetical protein
MLDCTRHVQPGRAWINARRLEWDHRLDRLGDYLAKLPDEEADDAQ